MNLRLFSNITHKRDTGVGEAMFFYLDVSSLHSLKPTKSNGLLFPNAIEIFVKIANL